MTTNSKKPETISTESQITRKDFWKCFRRSLTLDSSWNYERMQNLAYAYTMAPIIRRLYKGDKEKTSKALKR
ncbi:PTS system mannose/fructose/sorbose family transporter subunit IID, partial [Terrisporobacter hibernicus]